MEWNVTTELTPINAHMSTVYDNMEATRCIDGDKTGDEVCHSNCQENAPWLALEFVEGTVEVTRVDIYNRIYSSGERTRNVEVRLTNDLPTSGDQMYTGGELLGTFAGPGGNGEIIKVEGFALTGRYVLIQMDNKDCLNLLEVEVFGSVIIATTTPTTTTTNQGKRINFV